MVTVTKKKFDFLTDAENEKLLREERPTLSIAKNLAVVLDVDTEGYEILVDFVNQLEDLWGKVQHWGSGHMDLLLVGDEDQSGKRGFGWTPLCLPTEIEQQLKGMLPILRQVLPVLGQAWVCSGAVHEKFKKLLDFQEESGTSFVRRQLVRFRYRRMHFVINLTYRDLLTSCVYQPTADQVAAINGNFYLWD